MYLTQFFMDNILHTQNFLLYFGSLLVWTIDKTVPGWWLHHSRQITLRFAVTTSCHALRFRKFYAHTMCIAVAGRGTFLAYKRKQNQNKIDWDRFKLNLLGQNFPKFFDFDMIISDTETDTMAKSTTKNKFNALKSIFFS